MDKQTTLYLSEKDIKRIEEIKKVLEIRTTTDLIKVLLKEEYSRIQHYNIDSIG